MFFLKERIDRILTELKEYVYPKSVNIPEYYFKDGNFKCGENPNIDISKWTKFSNSDRWGGRDNHCWFKINVEIPEAFSGQEVVFSVGTGPENQWDSANPQFLIYVNGTLIQGLDSNHRNITLSSNAKSGEKYHIALHSYSGMKDRLFEIKCSISTLNREVEKLYYNIKVPLEVAELIDSDDKISIDIINYLNEAVNILDLRVPHSDEFNKSVIDTNIYLDTEFYGKFCNNDEVIAHCVGHTHIDVAYLWPISQTREKVARSFSTVLNLMKQYPEYIFMSSQPQLYKYVKEDYPELFEEIKKRVFQGRWEAEGGMWLEADCNLASGESLVRQILFGTRFFMNEFGVKNKILWLPDVFGYSAALPQILKKSNIDYFITTKISWNEYNKIPYDTFMWKGLDGTEILTHFITTCDYQNHQRTSHYTTYNGNLVPKQVMGAWQRYQQKNINNEVLICYGYGDGGGGPTNEMLENFIRMEKGIPGCPKLKSGNALEFFNKLEQKVEGNKRLPKWSGELYLEYHRGTYTSMAINKKYNRKSEFLYQDIEWTSLISNALIGTPYKQEKINNGWEKILLNQFHDILPGSSIKQVFEDSHHDYNQIISSGNRMLTENINDIAKNIELNCSSVVLFNQLSSNRSDIAQFDLPDNDKVSITDENGNALPVQYVEDNNKLKVLFYAENIPSKGYKCFDISNINITAYPTNLKAEKYYMSNNFFDIKFDANGNITSIYDKTARRELIKSGKKANVIQAFEDKPFKYDAWDINIYYQEKMWTVDDVDFMDVIETGPIRACLRIRKKFLSSIIEQDIYIYNDIPRIDFKTRIDWKETQILLKSAFPVDILANKATYDIQFGNVERPTHWNTSWDMARFEVCAHKWVDLSENGYGVSLLNDCKYGHDIKEDTIRITLLKSAKHPNIDADREIHEFSYSLFPHTGDWRQSGTIQMAYAFNCPLYTKLEEKHPGFLPPEFSMISSNSENVIIESIKKAEDSDGIIIRVYECFNTRTESVISFFKHIDGVWECDLMENNLNKIPVSENQFAFEIKPYEIKTFKLIISE